MIEMAMGDDISDFDMRIGQFIRDFCQEKGLEYGYVTPSDGGWIIRIDSVDRMGMEHPIESYLKNWFKYVEPTGNFNEYFVIDEMISHEDWYKSTKKSQSNIRKETDYRRTATFRQVTEEIEYVVNCMGEDIRRFDTDGGRFNSIADYKQQVKADTDQIFRAIERLEDVEVNGDEYAIRESAKKMKKSLLDIEDRFDELSADMQEIARNLCWTLQVNEPVIDKRGNDYYFLFSYYDGDPEYYFEELNIQQNSAEQYNYLNLSEIARNPPEWMSKSTKKMKKSYDFLIGPMEDYIEHLKAHGTVAISDKTIHYLESAVQNLRIGDLVHARFDCIDALDTIFEDTSDERKVTEFIESFDKILIGNGISPTDFHRREDYMASTKKSTPSIHDMIAQTRANNNSLVKSRVNIGESIKKEPTARTRFIKLY